MVYQLRIVLRDVSPLIWRRVLVSAESSIADLHATLQIALGWSDSHLNRFLIQGREYGVAHLSGISFDDDPRRVRLVDLDLRPRERFLYEYDFRDGWQHDIRVEAMLPLQPGRAYPVCVGGRRAVPLEDCGGPWAFLELRQRFSVLAIVRRLTEVVEEGELRERHEELLELRRWLIIDRFDRRAVNRQLARLAAEPVWHLAARRTAP
jgi:hypothetical protein